MSTNMAHRVWLRVFSGEPEGRCPSCLTSPVLTEYHDTVVMGMCKEKRDIVLALADDVSDVPDETTPHLCRGCPTCGYEWCEGVASAEDLLRVKGRASDDD
ncbi:hypothetical protein QFZ75_007936 [Streptomyces sp. V3I8]|uniref:hypothetical protein n=1 Tax=Streptomyces sp. V3I8 TaxID=3042279 RepID=UPI002781E932|nr:hypothetical protein [Streptomyces sp. V3I8]MDQ1041434.1 hypothetical protein [Streptomyces sp. V3I8]